MGVRNKYCYTCSVSKPGQTTKNHVCYKNYEGSSTAMEQDILVEGFRLSEAMHGVRYKYMIGDGDSSTYARIKQGVRYGRDVIKLECANHMVRNYTDKLHRISKDTSFPLTVRKELTPVIPRLTKAARGAIANSASENNTTQLREDLRNGQYHVFGDHSKCRDAYCKRQKVGEENKMPLISSSPVWPAILKALDPLVSKADKLTLNVTTNQAERFMGLITKLSGGKRKATSKSGGYKRCCLGAGLAHTKGPIWHYSPAKKLFGHSPGTITKKVLSARAQKVAAHKKRMQSKRRLPFSEKPSRKRKNTGQTDADYGPQAAQPDLGDEELEREKEKILLKLSADVATDEARISLERQTVGQHENFEWREARKTG